MAFVSERTSNPFGMAYPADPAVPGYGDVTADVHVIGESPDRHGGIDSGVPFTGSLPGYRIQRVLHELGFAAVPSADEPLLENCFLSYRFPYTPVRDGDAERFLDAELRAINAHILIPVGEVATRYVLETHTTSAGKLTGSAEWLHASEIRGRGFLVVPAADPTTWTTDSMNRLMETMAEILAGDYRQTKGVATTVG